MEEFIQIGSNFYMLCGQVVFVVKVLQQQFKDWSIRVCQGCFSFFIELVGVFFGSLVEYMFVLVLGIIFLLVDCFSFFIIWMDVLVFLQGLLGIELVEVFYLYLFIFLLFVMVCVVDFFYKIVVEVLVVLQELVQVLWLLDRFWILDFELYVGEMFVVILV